MSRPVSTLIGFVRALSSLVIAGVLAVAGWFGYQTYTSRDAEWQKTVAEQRAQIQQLEKDKLELETRNRLLKVDRRVARLDVVDQRKEEDGSILTKVNFVELDNEGNPLHTSRSYNLQGEEVWIDAWVVKFNDELVEADHPLQGRSVYWLKGIFSEHQTPAGAYSLDQPGSPPAAYREPNQVSEFEEEIWKDFWNIARDPKRLEAIGARAAGGEGPHQRVRRGERWKIELRSSGGLSFTPDGQVPGITPVIPNAPSLEDS